MTANTTALSTYLTGLRAGTIKSGSGAAPQAGSQSSPQTAPPPTDKYALTRTDFKFQGQPTQQKNCAIIATKPADRQKMVDACLQGFQMVQSLPDFRKYNMAAALTVLIGLSLQVEAGRELDEAETETLQRGLNDILVDSGTMTKLKPAEIQNMYETSIMTGGLIAGIAQAAEDTGHDKLKQLAQGMAKTVLQSFGVKP